MCRRSTHLYYSPARGLTSQAIVLRPNYSENTSLPFVFIRNEFKEVKAMKISIVTVCRNAEQSIELALKSVVNQTYQDIEYIVVDGASTDGTKDIIAQYGDRVTKLISEPDNGVYEAMNKGIKLASGQFIYFLNADDYLADETLVQDVVSFLLTHPDCDFLYGDLLFQIDKPNGCFTQLITFPNPEGIPEYLICDCLLHQASFAKADLFTKLGHFNETYRIGSDYEWFLKLIGDDTIKLCYYPRTIAAYNAGGMSSDMEKTLPEMFEIQNHAPVYQSDDWLKKRLIKYQDILVKPQGRFGLNRVPPVASLDSQLVERVHQLERQVKRLKARESGLKNQLAGMESTITAMQTSKFWKIRQQWFNFKQRLGIEKTESP